MKRKLFGTVWAAALTVWLSISAFAAQTLIPVGQVVGISLENGTVTVAGFDEGMGDAARNSGLRVGDRICAVDGRTVASARDLVQALEHSDGRVTLRLDRDGSSVELHMEPASTAYGPRLGVYVREGITGIGTVTYYDPQTGDFGALGHGVSDARGALADMETGKVYRARVTGVKPGRAGAPGQLLGDVQTQGVLGSIGRNTSFGIFGTCEGFAGEALPIAGAGKLHTGKAQILSNISGQEVETFSVEIVKLFDPEQHTGRDLMLHVTDPRLLEATGGIVAGMSGSPILQDGCLVGAVTHVLVNDPTRGYGISVENMLEAAG